MGLRLKSNNNINRGKTKNKEILRRSPMKKSLIFICLILIFSLVLVSCAGEQKKGGTWKDGKYVGEGRGYKSDIEVEVTVSEGKITEVKIVEIDDTPDIAEPAEEQIPKAIVDAQSTEVDVVSGATGTSNGIIEAVENALEKAKQ